MKSGQILTLLAGIISILGTYVFAVYGDPGLVGSGIGFILNLDILFEQAVPAAASISTPILLYYIFIVLFLIFLGAGVLQIIGVKNRIISLIFSLFPLGVGLGFFFLVYTDFLGIKTEFFALFFIGEQYGNIFPILLNLGDLGIGVYVLIAGGVLGVLSVFLPRE
jgi:hypothetical protein